MKLQDQVCTLEQAKRLKELGVIQAISPFYYEDWGLKVFLNFNPGGYNLSGACFSAFTVAELGVMLPAGYESMFSTGEGWRVYDMYGQDYGEECATEAECRVAMLVHLLENKSVTAEEVNKRLEA